jgi:DnaJ-class molecular chaperone
VSAPSQTYDLHGEEGLKREKEQAARGGGGSIFESVYCCDTCSSLRVRLLGRQWRCFSVWLTLIFVGGVRFLSLLFSCSLFGGGGMQGGKRKGPDYRMEFPVSLEDLYNGVSAKRKRKT